MAATDFFLLNENGSFLLLETGGKIILENVKTDQVLPFKITILEAQESLDR